MESDQEVVQLVGSEPYYADMMSSSLEECCRMQVFTQTQALEYIGNRIKKNNQRKPKPKARDQLAPHPTTPLARQVWLTRWPRVLPLTSRPRRRVTFWRAWCSRTCPWSTTTSA